MTQVWRRRFFVGLMAVHAIAFGVFWLYLGYHQLSVGVVHFYWQNIGGEEGLQNFKSLFYSVTPFLACLWIWSALVMLHGVLFMRWQLRREKPKRAHQI